MASRSRYLLVYDIRNDGRLRRVHRVALTFGQPLQYSVFVCDLTDAERVRLRGALREVMAVDVDSVAIFDLGPADGRGIQCVETFGAQHDVGPVGETIW